MDDGSAEPGGLVADRYRLIERIGQGGMGSVWKAEDLALDKVVALKQARPEAGDTDGSLLEEEARIGARVEHPNVVAVQNVVRDHGFWIVMSYVESVSLAALIDTGGPLPVERVAAIGGQIARGLQAVHAAGIVHGDVKPANILVTGDGTAKLTDFGVSRRQVWDAPTLPNGSPGGTPDALAPEVANGVQPTTASDMFSFGATLYMALDGRSPYGEDANLWATVAKAAQAEITPLEHGGELTSLINRLLREDPTVRPTAAQAVDELTGSASIAGPAAAHPWYRQKWTLAAAGVLAIALAATAIVKLTGSTDDASQPQSTSSEPSATRTSPAAGPIGDPVTADPCALIDAEPLTRYGETELIRDYGSFPRCDVEITGTGAQLSDVRVEFDNPPHPDLDPPGKLERRTGNVLLIARPPTPAKGEDCERTLVLSDRHRVDVVAQDTGDSTPMDLCGIAETVTTTAVARLTAGPVPRRAEPFPANSLGLVDSCTLLDAATLAKLPGIDANHPVRSFGGWGCEWESTTNQLSAVIRFDRDQRLTAEDGQLLTLSGRVTAVEPEADGPGMCQALITHRPYARDSGDPAVELVQVIVAGSASTTELCRLTTLLARTTAAKLPEI
ncbi:protein kinase domain-containing protein [Kribbella sp. DT2]|uniref:serine/threonine-protein kinase n=1 Tax=Kribbella sp. DT2 TaxID=3393427 RepID=UPI003CF5D4F0